MAYHQATIVSETRSLVFGVFDGSLISYDPEDSEIRTYSNQNGLSDSDIRQMAYHPIENALILVYNNSNIDNSNISNIYWDYYDINIILTLSTNKKNINYRWNKEKF
jgi:hypothetical protein